MSGNVGRRTAVVWADIPWRPLVGRVHREEVPKSKLVGALQLATETKLRDALHYVYVNIVNGKLSKEEVQAVQRINERPAFRTIVVREVWNSANETEWLIILGLQKRGQKNFSREEAAEAVSRVFGTFPGFETHYGNEASYESLITMTARLTRQ